MLELEEDPDSKVLELKLKALILETLHYIDIVRTLIEGKVTALDHWLWQKQLRLGKATIFRQIRTPWTVARFYLGRGGLAVVRMVDAEFEYTYEYQVRTGLLKRGCISFVPGKLVWPGLHRADREVLPHPDPGRRRPVLYLPTHCPGYETRAGWQPLRSCGHRQD